MDGWVSTKWLEKHAKQAAERERRRIQRLLRKVRMAGGPAGPFYWACDVDAIVRAPWAKRRRGK